MAGLITVDLHVPGATPWTIRSWLNLSFAVYTPVQHLGMEYTEDRKRDPGQRDSFSVQWGDTLHIRVVPKGIKSWVFMFTYEEAEGWTYDHWAVFIFEMFKRGVHDDDTVWIRPAIRGGYKTFHELLTGLLGSSVRAVQAKRDIDRVFNRLPWVDTLQRE